MTHCSRTYRLQFLDTLTADAPAILDENELLTLQKFSSVHAQVHNHFNQERHLVTRQVYKQRRAFALAEWRALAA